MRQRRPRRSGLAGMLAAAISVATFGCDAGETRPGTGGTGGVHGSGTGAGGTGGAQPVALETFAAASTALGVSPVIVSISDAPGAAGCALASDPKMGPPGDGHQILVTTLHFTGGDCSPGTFAIASDCTAEKVAKDLDTCAAYRKWVGGELAEEVVAVSGSVTVQSHETSVPFYCSVDVALDFGPSGAYSKSFAVVFEGGKSPLCEPYK